MMKTDCDEMRTMAKAMRAVKSESKRRMLDQAADMLDMAADALEAMGAYEIEVHVDLREKSQTSEKAGV